MDTFYNGMPAWRIGNARWQRSTYSSQNGNCVEVAELPTGEIAMRNSRDPEGSALVYTREELAAFVAGVKDGEFDVDPPGSGSPNAEVVEDTAVGKVLGGMLPVNNHAQASPRQDKVGEELEDLTERIGAGNGALDQAAAEQLLRVLGAVVSLHNIHKVDNRGNCSNCRSKTRSWRPAWWVHDICSVHATLNHYLGHHPRPTGGRTRPKRPSSES